MKPFNDVLDECRQAVEGSKRHDLRLGLRHLLYASLGEKDSNGKKRRGRLAIRSAEEVLPIWEKAFPKDRIAERLIDEARLAIDRKRISKATKKLISVSSTYLDDLSFEFEEKQIQIGAGYAALQSLVCSCFDESFDPNEIDLKLTDKKVNPDELDTAFFACAAYSGGATWNRESSPNKRREFWNWWLEAAESVYEDKGL